LLRRYAHRGAIVAKPPWEEKRMSIERIVLAVAGFFILVSVALGMPSSPIFHHTYWLLFTAFVGLNLLQSAFTGFCPMAIILKKLGKKPGHAF
jgi:hypothetical protein